jgi:hypothetical protein
VVCADNIAGCAEDAMSSKDCSGASSERVVYERHWDERGKGRIRFFLLGGCGPPFPVLAGYVQFSRLFARSDRLTELGLIDVPSSLYSCNRRSITPSSQKHAYLHINFSPKPWRTSVPGRMPSGSSSTLLTQVRNQSWSRTSVSHGENSTGMVSRLLLLPASWCQ